MLVQWNEETKTITLIFAIGAKAEYINSTKKHYEETFPNYSVVVGKSKINL